MKELTQKKTNFRWNICALLFFATTINYLDRQVLSLTWKDFIAPEFHWNDQHYGLITGLFSFVYALGMLFAGRFVDWMDTKRGFMWAIFIWSIGACLHAFCGFATMYWVGVEDYEAMKAITNVETIATIVNISVVLMLFARFVLAIGEAGNFPASIKSIAEFFPKKDRAYATSIFNSGATIGALAAPLVIPDIAKYFGWEMSFVIIGVLGFIWMFFWNNMYKKPEVHPRVNKAELEYILQDHDGVAATCVKKQSNKHSLWTCLKFRQTWAFAVGKFMTDGVWWFFLFWLPAYLSDVYGYKSSDPEAKLGIFVTYIITMLAIFGGYLPTIFVEKFGMHPYAGRMRAMLIFAFFPLLALFAQPLGTISYWYPVVIIGIAGAAHQSWSANIFSTVGDMFPKSCIATVTGIGGMAGGLGSVLINFSAGSLFKYAGETNMEFLGYEGKPAGYFIIFIICAVAYLVGWSVMKLLVPKFMPIEE